MSSIHSNISIFVPHLGCPNKCSFCNQHHIAGTCDIPTAESVKYAVEIAKRSKKYNPSETEIAFFGGSFTAIEREYMLSLLKAAKVYVDNGDVSGIRISTRPDAIDSEILVLLKEYGVTTIELGAQSMDDRVLMLNQRGHTAEDVSLASNLIKKFDFSLGLQMMTGLYGSDDETDINTAKQIIDLSPDCVRIYPTITLKNTKLGELYNSGVYEPPMLEDSVKLCVKINAMFEAAGISVIRLGLHTIDENAYIAGPWHPAFKELCDSFVFREKIASMLSEKGRYQVFVNPSNISKAIGQSKQNILYFKNIGYDIQVKKDDSLNINECIVKGCE